MKIAISADCFSSFTSGFPVRGMCLELVKLRSNDTFVLFYTNRKTPEALQYFYSEINNLPNVELRYFKGNHYKVAISRLLGFKVSSDINDIDIFISPGTPEYWPNLQKPQICSIADFSTLKGYSTGKHKLLFKLINKFKFRRVFERCTSIVTISEFTKSDLLSFWPMFEAKTTVIHNGIANFWFDDKYENCQTNPFKEEHYFIWWGQISRRKNIENLIIAYNEAKHKRIDLPNLLIVGKTESYMHDIMRHESNCVKFIPFQNNYTIKELVKNSCGLVFPSYYEGYGLPVVEAFSQGVPVACSNTSSLPEISNGKAILFNPSLISSIEEALLNLHTIHYNPNEYIEYAKTMTYSKAAMQYSSLISSLTK